MSSTAPESLRSLIYRVDTDGGATGARTLQVLDQLRLPKETVYIDITNVAEAYSVIQKMQIRGELLRWIDWTR